MKEDKLPIAAILTSFSTSLNKLVKIGIRDTSVISFPKASVSYLNFVLFCLKFDNKKNILIKLLIAEV